MITKNITGECNNCESYFNVEYQIEMVSQEIPEYCPFCGEYLILEQEDFDEEEDDEPL